jgi:acetylornithine deacetylase/succinyl-diaminopimelate desuccinylase-like protein
MPATLSKSSLNFLSLPNVAADPAGQQKSAAFIMGMMNKRGIQKVQLLNASTPGVPPAVYGEVMVPGAKQTLIFYAHYDGQPVNPAQWAKGLDPFQPKLFSAAIDKAGANLPFPADNNYNNDWRIYARGASDDKAGVGAILNAYDAITKSGLTPGCNLKFFFEGEEEAGSPHLNEILEKHKSLSNQISGSFAMDRFTNQEKSKLYLVFGAIRILILRCIHQNAHCIAAIMETGHPTLP